MKLSTRDNSKPLKEEFVNIMATFTNSHNLPIIVPVLLDAQFKRQVERQGYNQPSLTWQTR